jgi:hypothetical protein
MLIKDQQLDMGEFKTFYKQMLWRRVPRKLSDNHSDYFYVGTFEDAERIIRISVRPSMRMQVSESFKGYMANGQKAPAGYDPAKLVEYGTTVEVMIDGSVLDKIKEVAVENPQAQTQNVKWE